MFDVKTGGSGYINGEEPNTPRYNWIFQWYSYGYVFYVWDEIKRVALRPLQSHYKEGLTATGKVWATKTWQQKCGKKWKRAIRQILKGNKFWANTREFNKRDVQYVRVQENSTETWAKRPKRFPLNFSVESNWTKRTRPRRSAFVEKLSNRPGNIWTKPPG